MQHWITLLGTLLGALIAMGATLGNEKLKWRREQYKGLRDERKDTYSQFLAAATEAHETMRIVVLNPNDDDEHKQLKLREEFQNSGVYRLRYQVAIIASQPVLDAAETLFFLVRELRDELTEVGDIEADSYKQLRRKYGNAHRELQNVIRSELDQEPITLTGGS